MGNEWLKPAHEDAEWKGPASKSAEVFPTALRPHATRAGSPLRRIIWIGLFGRFKLRPPKVQAFLYPALKADIGWLIVAPALPRVDTPVVRSRLRSRVRTYSLLLLPTACSQNHAGISERREHALF